MTLLQRSNTTGSHHNKPLHLQNPIILASQAKLYSLVIRACGLILWLPDISWPHLPSPSAQQYASFFKLISIFEKFLSNFLFWEIFTGQDFESVLLLSGFLIREFICSTHSPYKGRGVQGGVRGDTFKGGYCTLYIVPNMANEPENNTLNIQLRSYTNGTGRIILEYVTADTIILIMVFIMASLNRLRKYL